MRIETTPQEQRQSPLVIPFQRQSTREPLPPAQMDQLEEPLPSTSQKELQKQILEAEQFGATVEPPPAGTCNINALQGNVINRLPGLGPGVEDDDDYFHLTCHVDNSLKEKIEHGKFVELERLLPKNRFNEENRFEWVTKDCMTFLGSPG